MKRKSIDGRMTALEHLSLGDAEDQLLQITSPQAWFLLLTSTTILVAMVVWGFINYL